MLTPNKYTIIYLLVMYDKQSYKFLYCVRIYLYKEMLNFFCFYMLVIIDFVWIFIYIRYIYNELKL